jgi:hypothetical protein
MAHRQKDERRHDALDHAPHSAVAARHYQLGHYPASDKANSP